ncbi:MAG: hypothetical protein OXN27_17035 [Candidatus Poribacteria bacterium]|nr:hypothetical protein [Candidatus Poribacteria bacterium]
MKEITYGISGRIQDPKTMNTVILHGVKLTGTPLQVGMIFDALKDLPGAPDVSPSNETDEKIFNMGQDALEQARSEQGHLSGDYEDPDKSDNHEKELARLRSNWRIHVYPTESE